MSHVFSHPQLQISRFECLIVQANPLYSAANLALSHQIKKQKLTIKPKITAMLNGVISILCKFLCKKDNPGLSIKK